MAAENLSQRELALRLNLDVSHLSRMVSGQRKWLDEETIAKMVKGIGSDPRTKGELLKAYLLDQCPENGKDLVLLSVPSKSSSRVRETSPSSADPVTELASFLRHMPASPRLVKTLKKMARLSASSQDFQKLLETLAKLDLREK